MEKILFLKGVFVEKIWGGDSLKTKFEYDIPNDKIGEYWAVSAIKDYESVITNLDNINFRTFFNENKKLFGISDDEEFPLLVKIIDAKDDLSIQIHPDDEMAGEFGKNGKTECWYILNENCGKIIYGHNEKDSKSLSKRILNQDFDGLFKEVSSVKGDFFYVPAGTVHAIGKGNLLLEIQQSSDITYRIYDYNRTDEKGNKRQLHIEESAKAASIDPKVYEKKHVSESENLIDEKFFGANLEKIENKKSLKQDKKYKICCVIEGEGEIILDEPFKIKKGDFFILTGLVEDYIYEGNLTIIEAYQ